MANRELPDTLSLPPLGALDIPTHHASLPPFAQHQQILDEFLQSRDADTCGSKLIAIDGCDIQSLHLLISHLQYCLTKDLKVVVRVFGSALGVRDGSVGGMGRLLSEIQLWHGICATLATVPSTQSSPGTSSQPPVVPPLVEPTCVYIVPMTPLMATLRAVEDISREDAHIPSIRFGHLASLWDGSFQPDITINIQEDCNAKRPVYMGTLHGTKVLTVMQGWTGQLRITPKQIKRVTFEVEDWLQED